MVVARRAIANGSPAASLADALSDNTLVRILTKTARRPSRRHRHRPGGMGHSATPRHRAEGLREPIEVAGEGARTNVALCTAHRSPAGHQDCGLSAGTGKMGGDLAKGPRDRIS